MSILFAYLLKLAFCLALGYAFYFLLLRHMTYYHWNRYFLALFPVAAALIPVLPVSVPGSLRPSGVSFFVTDVLPANLSAATGPVTAGPGLNWIAIAGFAMLGGMLFFLLRFAVRLYSLYRTRRMARIVHNGDIKLFHLDGCTAPFSFCDSIYLDTQYYSEQELEEIITHEAVHISQKHTMDTMLAELLCIVQWFNPFVWLLKNAIRQNLEFIADDAVLQRGASRTSYQYLLLKVSGAVPHSLANNLLFPSLKKRIQMMNREKTKRSHLLKFMCLVPLGCLLLLAFSGPAEKPARANDTANESFRLHSLSYFINDEAVAAIVQLEQAKSFLRTGGPLSLGLISEEKLRLKNLLEKNGYKNIDNHTISFTMDTSATTRSFSVQVSISIDPSQKQIHHLDPPKHDNTAIRYHHDTEEVRYIIASQNNHPTLPAPDVPAARTELPGAASPDNR